MRQSRYPIILALVALATAAPSLAGQAGPARSQAEIARDLRSHDRDRVAHALGEVPLGYDPDDLLGWKFPPDYVVTPELSAALISALDREARLHMDGCTVTGFEGSRHLELSLDLMHYVISLRDPASIPALVQLICSGGTVQQALLEFGPAIIPAVVEWAQSPGCRLGRYHRFVAGPGRSRGSVGKDHARRSASEHQGGRAAASRPAARACCEPVGKRIRT